MFGGLVDERTLKKLNNLKFKFSIDVTSQFEGQQKSKGKGSSVEFSDHREYMPGDDFRKINFRLYASTQKLYIKLFEQERQTTFNFFVDMSRSMDYGSSIKKGDMAKALVFCLSYIALSQQNTCSIFLVRKDGVLWSGFLKGKQSIQKLVHFLDTAQFDTEADFKAIKNLYIPRKSVSYILSDFMFDGAVEVLKILTQKSAFVCCCQVLDKIEADPFFENSFCTLVDSEAEEKHIDIQFSSEIAKEYTEELKKYQNSLKEVIKKANGRFFEILSSEPLEKILMQMIGVGR